MCWVDSKLSSLMHWVRDSCKQIQSYTLMLKPVFLTPLRFRINLVEFAIANCHRKFLWVLSLSTYKINYPSKYNLLLQLFLMHSCHTLFNHRIFSQIKGMHISAISFFSQFSVGTCPHTLFPLPPLIDDAHEISLFASKWTWKLWLTNCNQFLHLMSL